MAQRNRATVFPETIGLRHPHGAPRLIAQAAARQHLRASDYVRRAVFQQLERDGFPLDKSRGEA
jgi:hypothetical protein